jgi:hypothetical protein
LIPVFVNCRDRVTDLKLLVSWLERAGQERITLLDNASTWPPLMEYLHQSPHEVIYLNENLGSRAIWRADLVPDEWFAYSDPDVVPIEDCPLDAVEHLLDVLQNSQQEIAKVGFGLKIDDAPLSPKVRAIEEEWWVPWRECGPGLYRAFIDTTFAVHRPSQRFDFEAIRTAEPYLARHLSWYRTELDAEHRYYLDHAVAGVEGTSWKR